MRFGLKSLLNLLMQITISMGFVAITAPKVAFADNWDSTNLTANSLKEYINTERCYKNPEVFLGCIAALNSLLTNTNKILSNDEIKNLAEMKETVQNFGMVEIKNHSPFVVDYKNAASWSKFQKLNAKKNDSWKRIYFATLTQNVSMNQLLNQVLNH